MESSYVSGWNGAQDGVAQRLPKARCGVEIKGCSGVCDKQSISFARNNSAAVRGVDEGGKFGLAAALDL